MKVLVIATQLGAERGGLARYAFELLTRLGQRNDLQLVPVVQRGQERIVDDLRLKNQAGMLLAPNGHGALRAAWEVLRLGGLANKLGVDLIHNTGGNVLPRGALAPQVLTVHDTMNVDSPEQFPFFKRKLIPGQFRSALTRTHHVIAVSETTRNNVVRLSPTLAERTTVIRQVVPARLIRAQPVPIPEAVEASFALVVGDLSPRKNLGLLFGIWEEISRSSGMRLLVVGPDGYKSRPNRQALNDLVRKGLAIGPGFVTDGQLRWAYENAELVLLPALEEGYCFPAAEALALGSPVVASTDPAIVETCAGRARHIDGRDEKEWIRAILEARQQPKLEPAKGYELGDWDEVADETFEVYRQIVENRAPSQKESSRA